MDDEAAHETKFSSIDGKTHATNVPAAFYGVADEKFIRDS